GPIKDLIGSFKGTIIFTRHVHDEGQGNLMNVWWKDPINDEDAQIVDTFKPGANDILEKTMYSAFMGTDLDQRLRGQGVDSILIAGVMTDLCCETTARDAFMRGFRVYFLADCTASATEARHIASLSVISEGFGEVMTWRKAMSLL
ncbi:MAG: cysteine hydrolase, partial [Thermoplasmata archaeon]|nr:cysteine hydrolase [Thermoplasmata archaeon]